MSTAGDSALQLLLSNEGKYTHSAATNAHLKKMIMQLSCTIVADIQNHCSILKANEVLQCSLERQFKSQHTPGLDFEKMESLVAEGEEQQGDHEHLDFWREILLSTQVCNDLANDRFWQLIVEMILGLLAADRVTDKTARMFDPAVLESVTSSCSDYDAGDTTRISMLGQSSNDLANGAVRASMPGTSPNDFVNGAFSFSSNDSEDFMSEEAAKLLDAEIASQQEVMGISSESDTLSLPRTGDDMLFEEDDRTLIIKNIPKGYTLGEALKMWPRGSYNLLHMPYHFRQRRTVGYAFINFVSKKALLDFADQWQGVPVPSRRGISQNLIICRADVQGFDAMLRHIRGKGTSRLHLTAAVVRPDGTIASSTEVLALMTLAEKCPFDQAIASEVSRFQ